ncbi:MAG: ATP-binding protein, partial [Planctomycetota bacterium]|nr:ATP-binding protein [Planctomycetota bacterium]
QLREAQQRVVQTERLAAIGEMIAGLAHESRNALQRSQACLEMLSVEMKDRPTALNLVDRIQSAQDALHQLYEEVRDYAAPIRLKLSQCNVRRILEDTWDHLSVERTGRNSALVFVSSEGIPRCQADPLALEQVFRNILENAIASSANPVTIEVRLTDAHLEGRPALSVSIRDDGPGLTPESRLRIFEPFFTTKTKGTGLGMAITKRLVEAHAGAISLGDGAAGGAEVIVTLPREGPREGTL